jgi:NTE family protein
MNMASNKKIGLALSGGGVRAAAFHLGVLEKLFEMNILSNINVISTVSGGSIAGGYFLINKDSFNDFKQQMILNLQKSIELRIIFNWRILFAIINPYYSRTDVKATVYDKLYFKNRKFGDLKSEPQIIINATNIATGKNWKFSQKYMGDWKIGYDGKVENLKLSDAVAASTAVPGIFHPLRIKVSKYFDKPNFKIKRLGLCDGGVYDNQGTHALTSNYDKNKMCDYIICSDASAPFDDTLQKISLRLISVLRRQSNVMMSRIKNMQFQELIYGELKEKIRTAYFSINWTIDNLLKAFTNQEEISKKLGIWDDIAEFKGRDYRKISDKEFETAKSTIIEKLNYPELNNYLNNSDVNKISSIGTRLFALSKPEISNLIKHGSSLCGFQVRTYLFK